MNKIVSLQTPYASAKAFADGRSLWRRYSATRGKGLKEIERICNKRQSELLQSPLQGI